MPVSQKVYQEHIKQKHIKLTYACKLCPESKRYYYKSYEDTCRHIKFKHVGNNLYQNIIFPGDLIDLSCFAWVKCKTCDFKGIGLGREVNDHLRDKHRGGEMRDLNIFCRICDKSESSIHNYDDANDFINHMKINHKDML